MRIDKHGDSNNMHTCRRDEVAGMLRSVDRLTSTDAVTRGRKVVGKE